MTITKAIKEVIWLQSLYGELNMNSETIIVFCDNQSGTLLTKDQMFHGRSKHIEIRYHFVRDIISQGNILV